MRRNFFNFLKKKKKKKKKKKNKQISGGREGLRNPHNPGR
jgi:hypothetical protein